MSIPPLFRRLLCLLAAAAALASAQTSIDNSNALASALRQPDAQTTIQLEPGVYTLPQISVRAAELLTIAGRGSATVLDCSANCYLPAWRNVRLKNLWLIGRANLDDGDGSQPAGNLELDHVTASPSYGDERDKTLRAWNANANPAYLPGWTEVLKLTRLNGVHITESRFMRYGIGASDRLVDAVGVHDLTIERNYFERCAGGGCIQIKGGSAHGSVARNYLNGGGQRAIQIGGQTCDACFRDRHTGDFEAEDFAVVDNVIIQTGACFVVSTARNTTVENNTCLIPPDSVLPTYSPKADGTPQFGGGQFLFRLLQENDQTQLNQQAVIRRNAFYYAIVAADGRAAINAQLFNFDAQNRPLWDTFDVRQNAYFAITPPGNAGFADRGIYSHRHVVTLPPWTPLDPSVERLDQVDPLIADWALPSMRALAPAYADIGARVTRADPAGPADLKPTNTAPLPLTAAEWSARGFATGQWSDAGILWPATETLPAWYAAPTPEPDTSSAFWLLELPDGRIFRFGDRAAAQTWLDSIELRQVTPIQ